MLFSAALDRHWHGTLIYRSSQQNLANNLRQPRESEAFLCEKESLFCNLSTWSCVFHLFLRWPSPRLPCLIFSPSFVQTCFVSTPLFYHCRLLLQTGWDQYLRHLDLNSCWKWTLNRKIAKKRQTTNILALNIYLYSACSTKYNIHPTRRWLNV